MYELILRLFVKNYKDTQNPAVRRQYGSLAGWTGILLNFLLFIAKILAALFSSSIAIAADAINNLSDAASSVLTVFGFHLSGKPADKKHPYGHARFEYLFGLLISVIITVLGVQTLLTSGKNLITGTNAAAYSKGAVLIISLTLPVKLLMAAFVGKLAKSIESKTLTAAATDSIGDLIATSAILIGMLLTPYTGNRTDSVLGCLVSLYIIFLGIRLIIDTANPLIGTAPDKALIDKINTILSRYDCILGVHDMMIHSYGAGKSFASVHIEVDAKRDIMEIHDLIDRIEHDLAQELGIDMVIHMDPVYIDNAHLNDLQSNITKIIDELARDYNCSLSAHDFRLSTLNGDNRILFDLVVPSCQALNISEICRIIRHKVKETAPNYKIIITVDRGYTSKRYEDT
ncbi:MAG: cation transporter [Clostridiales bacterium]|nr:cation transporter [Clostridiales bacterium]